MKHIEGVTFSQTNNNGGKNKFKNNTFYGCGKLGHIKPYFLDLDENGTNLMNMGSMEE